MLKAGPNWVRSLKACSSLVLVTEDEDYTMSLGYCSNIWQHRGEITFSYVEEDSSKM